MMSKLLIIFLMLLFVACKDSTKWKTIEVGDYVFQFPPDFELIKGNGIDSYVGKIKGDSMTFAFDFGYYSNDFGKTKQEFLEKGFWKINLPNRFMNENIIYDSKNTPKVDILTIRPAKFQDSSIGKGCDYIAKCKHDTTRFDFPIYIPQEIKEMNFKIDTVDNEYRKIAYTKSEKGITGIYIKSLKSFNESMNSNLSLSITTLTLTNKERQLAFKIYATGKHKNL